MYQTSVNPVIGIYLYQVPLWRNNLISPEIYERYTPEKIL